MAKDINAVFIVGRLTRDAELKYLNNGTAVCDFSIAVNRLKRSGDQWDSEASFFDITMFGPRTEKIVQYLLKGQQIAVNGELRQDRWEKDGQTRSKVKIIANDIQLLGKASSGGGSGNYGGNRSENQSNRPSNESFGGFKPASSNGPENFEDDIPF